MNSKYPIYVISLDRWQEDRRLTIKALEARHIPYYVVIEPHEYDQYASVINEDKILVNTANIQGWGSYPARNFCWEHSLSIGAERHWVLDDNIREFLWINNNIRYSAHSGATFRAIEDWVDRYENVAVAGMNYRMFFPRKSKRPPITLNTRIYSCILIKNDVPYRWRGRYNEDTDLCLRVLKDGWCTALFQAFLADKMRTQTVKGGNTETLYVNINTGRDDDGCLRKSQALKRQHPDVTKVVYRYKRWHHYVDYTPFKGNKLIKKEGVEISEGINNYGMAVKN